MEAVRGREALRTVAAMARVCRGFTKRALDVLWTEQCSLRPLIEAIPEHVRHRWADLERSQLNKQVVINALVFICHLSDFLFQGNFIAVRLG
jgi:hypothetical protein